MTVECSVAVLLKHHAASFFTVMMRFTDLRWNQSFRYEKAQNCRPTSLAYDMMKHNPDITNR